MSAILLEKMMKMVAWSYSLSTITENTITLDKLLNDYESLNQPIGAGISSLSSDELVPIADNVNTHLCYMVSRYDIRDAPVTFRKVLMRAFNLNILSDNTCVVISQQLPEVAMNLIPDSIDILKKGTTISVACAVLYPELMIANLEIMKTASLIIALNTHLRGTGDGRNHEIPHAIECNPRLLLNTLWGRSPTHEIEYEKWVSCIVILSNIEQEDDILKSYTQKIIYELRQRIYKHVDSVKLLLAIDKYGKIDGDLATLLEECKIQKN